MSKKTLSYLKKLCLQNEKISVLTAYDASSAHWVDQAGIDAILVGDSLGMVVQGYANTIPVTLEQMVYHTQMVSRGNKNAWIIADMPFMADATIESCLSAAQTLLKDGQADMVKLEGGYRVLEMVNKLSDLGVPVCAHLGLLPQSVLKKGYQVAGKEADSAQKLMESAQSLEQAGAEMLVLECVPAELAKKITETLEIPVIGIGAGADTNGQVLVFHDVLGLTPGRAPKFSKNFLVGAQSVQQALCNYVADVKSGNFPSSEHIIA
jgi:3-methyl-2-oxobutanoate hydroxymethyltransferase